MKAQHLSDVIGEEYKEWGNGEKIFITAPTGSGKSYFVLHVLLKEMLERGTKMLYLVNRRILKQQLQRELERIGDEWYEILFDKSKTISDYIEIMAYQQIEEKLAALSDDNHNRFINKINKYFFVVYDECHYFVNDASFNTYTELSFDFLNSMFYNKIQVYMSATMGNVRKMLEKRQEIIKPANQIQNYINEVNQLRSPKCIEREYTFAVDYSYVDVRLFEDQLMLNKMIFLNLKAKKKMAYFYR